MLSLGNVLFFRRMSGWRRGRSAVWLAQWRRVDAVAPARRWWWVMQLWRRGRHRSHELCAGVYWVLIYFEIYLVLVRWTELRDKSLPWRWAWNKFHQWTDVRVSTRGGLADHRDLRERWDQEAKLSSVILKNERNKEHHSIRFVTWFLPEWKNVL